jgi:TPR repeat protein
MNLGRMYSLGQGVPQDYAQALTWYRRAADQGEAGAQFMLGVIYDNGQGVPQDYAQAGHWYRKATDQGQADAQYNLGVMYEYGQGGPLWSRDSRLCSPGRWSLEYAEGRQPGDGTRQ